MKGLILSLGVAVGLFGFTGAASAQWGHGHHHHHGWGGGHYHYIPGHSHFHADPWGGHLHYYPGSFQYHNGPDFIVPSYRRSWGGSPGFGYGGYGFTAYRYRPGFSFGLQIIR